MWTAEHSTPNRGRCQNPRASAFRELLLVLARRVAALGADRMAEALGVGLDDLEPLLAGRVQPPRAGMDRLRKGKS